MNRFILAVISLLMFGTGCMRSSGQTWEDLKTAGRYVQRGVDAAWGKDYESRMLTSDEEFIGPYDEDFIPLRDVDLKGSYAFSDTPLPQPKGVPGKNGTPSLSEFYAPPHTLSTLFHPVHFETDDHIVREKGEVQALMQMAAYLKKNPQVSLVVVGHCDERASASYNMALGMRRANYIRSFLVKQGVDLNRIYTVSRGKEEPLALGHSPEDLKTNRRGEFRIYQK